MPGCLTPSTLLLLLFLRSTALRAKPQADTVNVTLAGQLLSNASRPLIVLGKGAAQGMAEKSVRALAELWGLPCLATAMARGVVPDDHPLCVNAARSAALKVGLSLYYTSLGIMLRK